MNARTIFQVAGLLLALIAGPPSVAQTPSPALLVLEKEDSALAIVDPRTLKVVGRVPAGPDPHEVVASDDGKTAYISNYGAFSRPQHTISVVDLAAQKALPAIDLSTLIAPHGLDFVEGKVYFTAEGSKIIGRYDPASQRVDWVLGIGQNRTHMVLVAKDLNQMFTSDVSANTITILEHDQHSDVSGWTETHIAVGAGPEGFDVSPDGKMLWAANSHDGTVSIVDVTAKKVVQTIDAKTKSANRLKFTPDGRLVLISELGTGDLVVVDARTREPVDRISLGHGAAGIQMVPDGSRAFVAVSRDDYVSVVDLKSLKVIGRISTGKGPDGMAWAVRK
ncbi:MAG TPA: cytochrome D1 domain-containing protein [Candidatus Sulfotelmatobacter sp.]|nr:cytochrome D1 domain-containing protein [Candidatus Sulfotelmatobacter sp.]